MWDELPIELDIENPVLKEQLKVEIENRLQALAEGHSDLTGASIALEQPVHGETDYLYQARVVVYTRPENIYASEKKETAEGAMKAAIQAVERQVREKRDKLGEPWKRLDRQ